MSALKSLPAAESVGWYVRTRRTDEDPSGLILGNFGAAEPCHFVFANAHGALLAAVAAEGINTTRESGIGPAETRRQRDELLAALMQAADALSLATTSLAEDRQVVLEAQRKARAAISKAEGFR